MFWIIFISILILTLLWILLAPVHIYADSGSGNFHLRLPGIFRASLVPEEELFGIRGWIFFIPYRFNPFKRSGKSRKKEDSRKPGSKSAWRNIRKGRNMAGNMMTAFRIRRLRLDIDTDDFILNAMLVPAFTAINSHNVDLQVNFEGRAALLLDVRTSLGNIIWAFIKTGFQNKYNH